ncbi:MAG: hypothetical protein PX635_00685 [Nostocales cyanobacterium LE14-WE12]|jgi:hypothetical protein|nr:hypothetical protein [Nostocales cyanobacterium LE14-WE12]
MSTVNANVRLGYQDAAWFTTNAAVVLLSGQIVYRSTDGKYIIGDGSTAISGLTFYGGVGGGGGGLTVGTSTITSGTNTRILYNNAGVLGEYSVTGTGTTAVLSTDPLFTSNSGTIQFGNIGVNSPALWFQQALPTNTNYTIFGDNTDLLLNNAQSIQFRFNNVAAFNVTNQNFVAAQNFIRFLKPALTNQTSASERIGLYFDSGSTEWAGNTAITTQRNWYITAPTYTSVVAGKVFTNTTTLFIEPPVISTNCSSTNNWAIMSKGDVYINTKLTLQGISTNTTATINLKPFDSNSKSIINFRNTADSVSRAYLELNELSGEFSIYTHSGGFFPVFYSNGVERMRIDVSGNITLADGVNIITNTTTGSRIFNASNQKGAFWGATPVVQPSGYTTAPTGTLNRTTFNTSTATLTEVAQRLAALMTDLRTIGLIGA